MQKPSTKSLVASALLGAVVAAPVAYVFSASVLGALAALVGGAAILAFIRRTAGNRLALLGILTWVAVIIGGPLLLTIASALSPSGTGNAGFAGLLFIFALAGQLVAVPLGLVTALVHVILARLTK